MPQDRASGAEADRYGRETARQIARALGAEPLGLASNECRWKGELLVIKCARRSTGSVGVSYRMLKRVGGILAAFEDDRGGYDVYRVAPEFFADHLRPTRSKGPSAGRVAMLARAHIVASCPKIARIDRKDLSS